MFTSGSTGKPKGVMVPHGGVVSLLHSIQPQYASHCPWVFGLSTNYTFDPFVRKLFLCLGLLRGKALLLADSLALVSLPVAMHVTHLGDVPSVMGVASIPPSVAHVEVAGEAVTQVVVDRVGADVTFWNNYGPTEVTVDVTGKCMRSGDLPRRLASIGRPLPNVTCYVVDPDGD
eukprot:6945570-Prymnesium_polylepis.1